MKAATRKPPRLLGPVQQEIARIQAGLSFRAVAHLRKALGIPLEDLAAALGMSRATLHRRKQKGRIAHEESEKLVRYQRLLAQAERVLGDVPSAREWLTHPQFGLGNAIPWEFARTELGSREVENLLGRIEYGVYS